MHVCGDVCFLRHPGAVQDLLHDRHTGIYQPRAACPFCAAFRSVRRRLLPRRHLPIEKIVEKRKAAKATFPFGAGSRGRTDTVSLPPDFESGTSANSITPAHNAVYYTVMLQENQVLLNNL